jgi:hypothetical protein
MRFQRHLGGLGQPAGVAVAIGARRYLEAPVASIDAEPRCLCATASSRSLNTAKVYIQSQNRIDEFIHALSVGKTSKYGTVGLIDQPRHKLIDVSHI